jgi:hypothetical protein
MRSSIRQGRPATGHTRRARTAACVAAVLALFAACSDEPTGFDAGADGPPIVVTAAQPRESGRGETMKVTITGSGFRKGDEAVWERDGSADDRVVVERTEFVSPTQLIVTITVQSDAAIAGYDIAVDRPRKRGIGTEAFYVLHGIGAGLHARFSFTYDGYRSGSFNVDHSFVLDPATVMTPGSWGLTYYDYEWREQVLAAHYLRDDGLVDQMWCEVPGGKVTAPGTRELGCWFTPQYNYETGEFADPEDYTSWTGDGGRPGDGTGRVTFTSVTPDRLAGTFSITMHVVDWPDWFGSPSITISDGAFDLPVVSSYYQAASGPQDGDEDGDEGGEVGGDWVSMNGYEMLRLDSRTGGATGINSTGLMVGWLQFTPGYNTAVRWTLGSNGKVTGPGRLGSLPAPYTNAPSQVATGVNAAGVVVGYALQPEIGFISFVYDGEMKLLPHTQGVVSVFINDQGLVVGTSDGRASVWSTPYKDPPMRLPPLDGDDRSSASLIDNQGHVVGRSSNSETGSWRWVSWHVDGEDVTGPAEFEMPDGFSAGGMNSAGDVVGFHRPGSHPEPVLLRSGALTALGFPDGSNWGRASSINDPVAGHPFRIIGSTQRSGDGPDGARITVWTVAEDGTVSEPVDLGYGGAGDINAHGWIVGVTGSGSPRAGVWRPATKADAGLAPAAKAGAGLAPAADRPCRTHPRRPRTCR